MIIFISLLIFSAALNAESHEFQGEEKVIFKASDNMQIEGSIFYPSELIDTNNQIKKDASDIKKYPCVMLFHQWHVDRYSWSKIIPVLQKNNFVVFTFDFRGHGKTYDMERQHIDKMKKYSEAYTKNMIKDAYAAYEYVQTNIDVADKNRVSVVGSSIGTLIAVQLCEQLAVSKKYPLVKSMVLLSPAETYFAVHIEKSIMRCTDTPILFLFEKNDPNKKSHINYKSGMELCRSFEGKKEVIVLEDVGHGIKMLNVDYIVDYIAEWIGR